MTYQEAYEQLKLLGFVRGSSISAQQERLLWPTDLAAGMSRNQAVLYPHPETDEVRLLIYPRWDNYPPTMASKPMRRLYRKLARAGLGDLMLEVQIGDEDFEQLAALVDHQELHLTSHKRLSDERSESELLEAFCAEASISHQDTSSFAELLSLDPEAIEKLFAHHLQLTFAAPISALDSSGRG